MYMPTTNTTLTPTIIKEEEEDIDGDHFEDKDLTIPGARSSRRLELSEMEEEEDNHNIF